MARRRKHRRRFDWLHKAAGILIPILTGCVILAAFVVEYYGGQGCIPTWNDLYDRFGIESSAPDAETVASGDSSVSFLDVGQGDAVLICQDGEFCLIDAGTAEARGTAFAQSGKCRCGTFDVCRDDASPFRSYRFHGCRAGNFPD